MMAVREAKGEVNIAAANFSQGHLMISDLSPVLTPEHFGAQ
jgi:hypothetical protein